jgi:bifunctional DNA-binding transcriptional regulator/antitoxin component of YhaV-PrlF toxin-antitoxin module
MNVVLEMGEKTKVVWVGKGRWPRTTIPATLARLLDIKPGDVLDWDIEIRDKEKVLVVRKVSALVDIRFFRWMWLRSQYASHKNNYDNPNNS